MDLSNFLHPAILLFLLVAGVPSTLYGIYSEAPGPKRSFIARQAKAMWIAIGLLVLSIYFLPAALHAVIAVVFLVWFVWYVAQFARELRRQADES